MDQNTKTQNKKKHSFVLFLNLGLTFTLLGIILSFFIFSYEKNGKNDNFLAYAQGARSEVAGNIQEALSVQQAIKGVVDKNMPGVVNISTEIAPVARTSQQDKYADDFFRFFFGEQMPERKSQKSLGSGFIIDEEGYVLSNYHVVKGASKITIMLYGDDEEYPAELVGYDEGYDLALLKIKAKKKFPFVMVGDSDQIEPGEFAIAIGNPYGLNNTVTFGIVSAKGRSDVGANRYQRYIQTDVAINPGNSGGPLFNIYGEVIGINTMIYSTSGGSIGIGFATPINIAKSVMKELKETGKVTRGYLGIYPQDIDENLAKGLNVKQGSGVYVSEVIEGSPAGKAGIEDGDIITEIDGKKMTKAGDLFNTVAELVVGKKVTVKYLRGGREKTATVTIEARKEEDTTERIIGGREPIPQASQSWMDLEVSNVTPDLAKRLQIKENEKGVVVINMMQDTKAYAAGLRPGDIIKAINGKTIANITDYNNFVKSSGSGKSFTITVKRARMTYVIIIE